MLISVVLLSMEYFVLKFAISGRGDVNLHSKTRGSWFRSVKNYKHTQAFWRSLICLMQSCMNHLLKVSEKYRAQNVDVWYSSRHV